MTSPSKHVVILGAGVTGLTSALFLAQAGYKVTVLAAHVPGDSSIEYTSPWAGAHWKPHSTPNEPELCDWDKQSLKYWFDIIERESREPDLPKSGLKAIDSFDYWESPIKEPLWWAQHVPEFRKLTASTSPILEINNRTTKGAPLIHEGVASKAVAIDVLRYLQYLQERVRSQGGEVFKTHLVNSSGFEAAIVAAEKVSREHERGDVDCYVNCTGLGAYKLCGDENMYPIRGQTVLVKGEADRAITRRGDSSAAYVIPRPGSNTTILGGTKEVDVWDETPNDATTKRILEQNSWAVPELLTGPDGKFEVISVQCGLRPGRKGGPRMEKESVGGRKVVHAYGHAGGGYQNSVGSARVVQKLVHESLR